MKISKDEYILRTFSKIQHKKWELYVITRIIHLLNDPEIEFVCQQLVKTPDNKRYLTDLCFPELNLYCEIDELQHSSKEHSFDDERRMQEIIDATDFVEKRIKMYDRNNKYKNLKDINSEIDDLVNFIINRKKQYIAKNKFIPWDYYNKYNPEVYIKRGYLDIKDNVSFLYIRDALRCFGYKGGHYQKAIWNIKGTSKYLWFPKLYKNNDWNNTLSNDLKVIEMRKEDNSDIGEIKEHQKNNLVFAHSQNQLGQTVYKFIGEFNVSFDKSDNSKHIYIRKNTNVVLNHRS
tara:strand:- start:3044 stop:3913 length:870 start_codon:yes stop_codon:yes gene_type:complete